MDVKELKPFRFSEAKIREILNENELNAVSVTQAVNLELILMLSRSPTLYGRPKDDNALWCPYRCIHKVGGYVGPTDTHVARLVDFVELPYIGPYRPKSKNKPAA